MKKGEMKNIRKKFQDNPQVINIVINFPQVP